MMRRAAPALLALAALVACNGWTHPEVGVTPRTGRLRVAVADGVGLPVPGAAISLAGETAGLTGADGVLVLGHVLEGGYLVAVDAQGFDPETLATPFVLSQEGGERTLNLSLRAAVPFPPELRLAFAGDLSFESAIADPNRDGIQDDSLVPSSGAADGAAALLQGVTPLLSRFDLVTASLATVLGRGATPHPRKSDRALAPQGVALGLSRARVDAVVLGNDHAYDFLDAGVAETLDALDLSGVLRVGAGRNLVEAAAPLYLRRLGVTGAQVSLSALLGHGTSAFSDSPPYFDADANRGGVAAANPLTVADAVTAALGGTVDVVPSFVVAHLGAGPEWGVDPSTLGPLADAAAAAGAVLVVGHGPRQLQGLSRSGRALVAGGLGQLVYGSSRPEGRSGVLLEARVRAGRLTSARLWPLALVHDRPRVATGDLANRVIRRVAALSAPAVLVYPLSGRGEVALANDATRFIDQPRRAVVPVLPGPVDSATPAVPLLPGELESSVLSVTASVASGPDRSVALELGRELLWDGGFEEQAAGGPGLGGAAGWDLNAPDGGVSDRSVRTGRLALELVRKSANTSEAVARGQGLLTLAAGRRYTLAGCWRVEGGGLAHAALAIHGSRALHAPVIGQTAEASGASGDWTCFAADVQPLVDALVAPEIRLAPPTTGTSRLYVDDLSLVEWDPPIPAGAVTLPLPNEYEFLRGRLPEGAGSVEFRWTARRFVPQ